MSRLYDGRLVAVDPSPRIPHGFEVTLKRSGARFHVGPQSARDLLAALSALLGADRGADATPVLPPLRCASCGREIGPRPGSGNVVQRCPHCHTLGFWPKA